MSEPIQFLDPEPIDIIKDDSEITTDEESDTVEDVEDNEPSSPNLNLHIINSFNENDDIDTTVTNNSIHRHDNIPHTIRKKRSFTNSIRSRTVTPLNDQANFLRVQVVDCTMVKGIQGNTFAVWKIKIMLETKNTNNEMIASTIEIYRRYSEFVNFREQLMKRCQYYKFDCDIPRLPPKLPWYYLLNYEKDNLDRNWLVKRQMGLNSFLNDVIMNKEILNQFKDLILQFIKQ